MLTIIKIVIFIVIFSPIDSDYLNANDVTINHFARSIIVSYVTMNSLRYKSSNFLRMWRLSRPSSRLFSVLVVFLLISLSACCLALFRVTRGHPRKSSPYGFAAGQKHEDEHFSDATGKPGLSHFRKSVGGTSANKCLRVAGTNYVCPAFNVLLTHATSRAVRFDFVDAWHCVTSLCPPNALGWLSLDNSLFRYCAVFPLSLAR